MSLFYSAGLFGSAIPDSVVSRSNNDDNSFSVSQKRGVKIETSQSWPKIGAKISAKNSGFSTAYIHLFSDGTLIDETDISSLAAGDTFVFDNAGLNADTAYSIVLDNNGSDYTNGWYDSASYPYTSNDGNLSATGSISGDMTTVAGTAHFYSFVDIGNVGFS